MSVVSKSVISEFADEVNELKGVEEIILYGSYAREEAVPGSDVDILVLTDGENPDLRSDLEDIAGEYWMETNVIFSPKIIEKEKFEEKIEEEYGFHSNALEEGVKL